MSSFRITSAQSVEQAVDRGERVRFFKEIIEVPVDKGAVVMVRKRLDPPGPTRGAVVLIHGFGQNRYSWHLSSLSFANYLAKQGFDVFNIDLRGHGRSRKAGSQYPNSFEEYIEHDMREALGAVAQISGHAKAFLIGHSLGGAVSYAAAARLPNSVAGVISIGGLYRFALATPIIRYLAQLYRIGGWMIDPLLHKHVPFVPVDLSGHLLVALHPLLDHPAFGRSPIQVWYPGTMEFEVVRERMVHGMDRTGFSVLRRMIEWAATGEFSGATAGHDYAAEFAALNMPLLVIAGDKDMLLTPRDAIAAYNESQSTDKMYRQFGPGDGGHWGHVDLIFGRRAPAYVWPVIGAWLTARTPAPKD